MTPSTDKYDGLYTLLDDLCDGSISASNAARLDCLLQEDPAARREYLSYLDVHAGLGLLSGKPLASYSDDAVVLLSDGAAAQHTVGAAVELPHQLDLEPRTPSPEPPFPSLSTTNYPLPTSDFVGSWAFSYMVATVIMGVTILGFWAYKITHHQHIAEAPSQSVPSDVRQEMVFVGRITGMVDVKWSDDPHYLPPPGFAHVPLGRKYKLDSGLMQITYDSGAKVILQGPCTYEVESTAGGFLSLGKLTARVGEDKETKRQGDKGKKADAASPHLLVSRSPGLPVSPLFSVRTPTAVVTDLGTEFGVEVSKRGQTKTQVFVGSVRLAAIAPSGEAGEGRVLSTGQIGIVQLGNAAIVVADANDGSITFARVMPPRKDVQKALADAYAELVMSLGPVAYYRMERPDDEKELLTVLDSAPGGRHGKLSGVGRAGGLERLWCAGRFGGGLELRGEFFGDYVIAPRTPDCDSNQYSFSAWILADSRISGASIASEGGSRNWFRLKFNLIDGFLRVRVIPLNGKDSAYSMLDGELNPFPTGQWRHMTVVADGAVLRLYSNGVEVRSMPCDGVIVNPPGKHLLLGCGNNAEDPAGLLPSSFWDGRIDEAAIFHRALTPEEARQLYEGPVAPRERGDDAGHTGSAATSTERGVTP